jgi:hypothetical protein
MRMLLCAPFTLSIPFTSLSLSPLYPFHLSIPFTSLSLSPLYPFPLSIPFPSLSLSPLYPFHLSLSLSLSNGRFHPCFLYYCYFQRTVMGRSYIHNKLVTNNKQRSYRSYLKLLFRLE